MRRRPHYHWSQTSSDSFKSTITSCIRYWVFSQQFRLEMLRKSGKFDILVHNELIVCHGLKSLKCHTLVWPQHLFLKMSTLRVFWLAYVIGQFWIEFSWNIVHNVFKTGWSLQGCVFFRTHSIKLATLTTQDKCHLVLFGEKTDNTPQNNPPTLLTHR